ncbi:hypothetical protein ACIGJO_12390 [Streptomyces sp. NPDC079020]|uniref:hypothetical protein n=1 Tax=Streptomyces sp. NPDC079020 TaxID=3365722 RepID=UPI0037D238D5
MSPAQESRAETVAPLEASVARPLPIDMVVARRVVAARRVTRTEAGRAAGPPDGNGWLTELVQPDFGSWEEFTAALRGHARPDRLSLIPGLCAEVLGEDARTVRTPAGGQELNTPFFHHGDLVVDGDLDVWSTFVVTGSLTVSGVLADCAPDSVVAVGGDVRARAVHTEGEMSVGGAIEADVVYGYYNNQTLRARTIRARLVIEDDHRTDATVEAETHLTPDDYQQGYGTGVQEVLREILVDEVFSDDEDQDEEQLDRELLFARLRKAEQVFRTSGIDPAADGTAHAAPPAG